MASVKDDCAATDTLSLPEDADYAILRQPLNAGVTNIRQILKCIKSGSREVKDIILNECNIIYECKVCQSLFRSLANFLYHKRGFCKKHLCEGMLLFETFDESETITVQPTAPNEVNDSDVKDVAIAKPNDVEVQVVEEEVIINDVKMENAEKNYTSVGDSMEVNSSDNAEAANHDIAIDVETLNDDIENIGAVNSIAADAKSGASIKVTLKETSSAEKMIPQVPSMKIMSSKRTANKKKNVARKITNIPETTRKSDADNGTSSEESSSIEIIDVESMDTDKSSVNKEAAKAKQYNTDSKSNTKNENVKTKEVIPIILKTIAGNQNAMFQVVKKAADHSAIPVNDKKVNPPTSIVCNKPDDNNKKFIIVLPNKAKIDAMANTITTISNVSPPKDIHLSRRKRLLNRTDCCVQALNCLKCGTQFTTMKTLYFHMMAFHSQKRIHYPCPYCKVLFLQMYGVTRHLIQFHGKNKDQINNKMRDMIRKSAIWKKSDNIDGKDTGERSPEKENDSNIEDNNSDLKYLESYESDAKLLNSYVRVENNVVLHHCSKCERVFSRKSSQVSHEKFCIMASPVKSDQGNTTSSSITYSPRALVTVLEEKKNPFEIRLSSRPKRGAEKQMHKDFVDSQTLKWRSANKIGTFEPTPSTSSTSPKKVLPKSQEKKIMSLVNSKKLLCLKCNRKFSSFSNLRRHAAIHIGWTRFRCKSCEYQSYNKSDCIHHVQRMHTSIAESDIEKHVIPLVSESFQKPDSPKTAKLVKNANTDTEKNATPVKKKVVVIKKNLTNQKKSPSPQKRKHTVDVKTVTPSKKLSAESYTDKAQKTRTPLKKSIQSVKKQPPNNYRSHTTNNPTTIILSKTCSSSSVQITKNTAPIPIYNRICSSNNKVTPTRISPRKSEPSVRILPKVNIVNHEATASLNPKTNVMMIKMPPQVSTHSSPEKRIDLLREESPTKRSRPISDWFIRKEYQRPNDTVPRREPVIIDLVRASSSIT